MRWGGASADRCFGRRRPTTGEPPRALPGLSPRTILFRLHWALGLTAGLVLAVMGATGALISYEEALIDWANRDRAAVAVRRAPRLAPGALIARIEAGAAGQRVDALTLADNPAASVRARFGRAPDGGPRPISVYADPYDGTVIGTVRWEAGFATVRALHRWLLVPGDGKGWGRTLTGACAVALVLFLATGLYLRWPQVHRWRIWLKPHLARPGRARWWSLHAVAGTWLAPVYLVIALSGLTWSYDWFKDGANLLLTGQAGQARPARRARGSGPPALDAAWAAFQAAEGRGAAQATLFLPAREAGAIRIRWLARGDETPGASNEATFNAATGTPLGFERAADMPLGRKIARNMLEVHRGRFFGDAIALLFCLAALVMPGFAATGIMLYVLRRRAARRRATPASALAPAVPNSP